MTSPDHPENRALQAAQQVSVEVGRLWMAAFTQGMREGIASAAVCLDATATQLRDDHSLNTELRIAVTLVCEHTRDQLRLSALTITDPDTVPWDEP